MHKSIVLSVLIFCQIAVAEAVHQSQVLGSYITHNYDSRNIFSNPAALGFNAELNGAQLFGGVQYGLNRQTADELNLSLAWGALGLGYEKTTNSDGTFNRWSLGLGIPLTPMLFAGVRYRFMERFDSLDFGVQFRPRKYLSVGLTGQGLTQSLYNGAPVPVLWSLGIAIRPHSILTLFTDVNTPSNAFGSTVNFQAGVECAVVSGIKLQAGYHSQFKWQFGVQIDWMQSSVYASAQPQAPDKALMMGLGFSTVQYPSVLNLKQRLRLDIDSSLAEEKKGNFFFTENESLTELIEKIERSKKEDLFEIEVHIDSFPLGLASAEELFEALWRARNRGLWVSAFIGNAGIKEYLIASAAHKIYQYPQSELRLLGLRSERFYAKGTLDKIGIEPQFMAKGEYKSAPEMFMRKEGSKPSVEATLDEIQKSEEEILRLLSLSKRVPSQERWADLKKVALLSPQEAKEFGLIDDIASQNPRKTLMVKRDNSQYQHSLSLPNRVTVIALSGDILDKKIPLSSVLGYSAITPQKVKSALSAALADDRTVAVILRVSSPGGEVLASEKILNLVREFGKHKPVYISMGDMAASGGYLISMGSKTIFADNLTETGSIGVFLGKFSLAEIFKKIDLQKQILTLSPFASLYSESKPWSIEEKKILQKRVDQYYADFLSEVSAGRGLSTSEVDRYARGRVWLGSDALKHKLVDYSGGIWKTFEKVSADFDISPSQLELYALEEKKFLWDMWGGADFTEMRNALAEWNSAFSIVGNRYFYRAIPMKLE